MESRPYDYRTIAHGINRLQTVWAILLRFPDMYDKLFHYFAFPPGKTLIGEVVGARTGQQNLNMSNLAVKSPDSSQLLTLVAQPNSSGFFGLTALKRFTGVVVQPYVDGEYKGQLLVDLSRIKFWDISALLWLVVALHYYRQAGLVFLLKLPTSHSAMSSDDIKAFDQSADFLRRWRFDVALKNITPEIDTLLINEQKDYFAGGEPHKYYRPTKTKSQYSGIEESFISRSLFHIRNLAEVNSPGTPTISDQLITECIAHFQSERIGDILQAQCGILKRDGDLFAEHLLTEALLNVREHPNASIGMLSIAILGATNELILSVVDNGDSIPHTILPAIARLDPKLHASLENLQRTETIAKIVDFATQPGVTSKTVFDPDRPVGMGLTYIKRDTIDAFQGRLRIITDSVFTEFQESSSRDPKFEEWSHSWPGNLLRIAIPLKPKEQPAS